MRELWRLELDDAAWDGPLGGSGFNEKGLIGLNDPRDRPIAFTCKVCFEREMESPNSEIRGEG